MEIVHFTSHELRIIMKMAKGEKLSEREREHAKCTIAPMIERNLPKAK